MRSQRSSRRCCDEGRGGRVPSLRAQRSNPSLGLLIHGLLRFARNDAVRLSFIIKNQRRLRDPAARCVRVLQTVSLKTEGAGNAGCALHPRSRVHIVRKKRTRAYRFSGNTPTFPAQWLYGLWRALPGDEFVLSPSSRGLMARQARLSPTYLRGLDTSNGCQNHTLLPYASAPFVLRAVNRSQEACPAVTCRARRCRVHRNPSRVRDDRDPPLLGDEMGQLISLICPTAEGKCFCMRGLDDPNHLEIPA